MRKTPSLGPARAVRTIPISAAEPVKGRRTFVPLDPALADLASGLLPPTNGGEPAAWSSWSVQDQAAEDQYDEWFRGVWETPVVDGEAAGGNGVGFPEPELDNRPIGVDDITCASQAGWAAEPNQPTTPRSWVGSLAQAADATPPTPAAPSGDLTGAAHAPVDMADFAARLERGAAFAATERQLLTLAERALARLSPAGASRWLAASDDDMLAVRVGDNADAQPRAGCAVAETKMCPAIASGRVQHFDRSDELDACPQLLAADGPACTVVCVPVPTAGALRGVVHVTAPVGAPLSPQTVELIGRTARAIAERLAEIRSTES